MPKPKWVEKRNNLRKMLRMVEEVVDQDVFLDAFDEMETSDEALARATDNPEQYLKDKGVKIPPGLEVRELSRKSPGEIVFWLILYLRITWN
jgi:hypothetical protein